MSVKSITYSFILLFVLGYIRVSAQNPQRFEKDVIALQQKYDTIWESNRPTLLFTGSSSIRLWENLEDSFPDYQVVNTGFGGSQTADLLAFIDELVLNYKPEQVFIYEGDNDIEDRKKPRMILRDTRAVIERIKNAGTASSIVLISAKPSIARWHLKGKYKKLNRKMEKLCEKDTLLQFVNIWDPMLNGRKLRSELFVEDGLHMNAKGYEIWHHVIKEFVK